MKKLIHWTLHFVLVFFSPALFALGLGGAEVESYLDQPLDVRIELISQSGEELQSVTAGLASAQDFELLGMSRTAISVPLEFELVTDTTSPYIHITSALKVGEPVVQVLVEVIWANGRMLREYTLFLDPPTFDSPAPPAAIKQAPKSLPKAADEDLTATVQRTPVSPEPVVESPESLVDDEPVEDTSSEQEAGSDADTSSESSEADSYSESSRTESEPSEEWLAEDEVYGPVATGETLWGIARDFSQGSGYSLNQAMLALQRKNPDAFIKNNINSLKRGAILRLPAFSEIGELSSRDAMLEVMRQEEEIKSGVRSVSPDFTTPTVADSGDYQETTTEQVALASIEEELGHLELVPPVEEDSLDSSGVDQTTSTDQDSELIREELSRTEEELVNIQQENTYLNQRIEELEAQVAAQADQAVGIEDSGLANMESSLAKDRAEDQEKPPVAVTPGGEELAWYAGKTPMILGGAVVLIALIVWGLRRRSTGQKEAEATGAVAALAVEAEDTLRTLHAKDNESETVVQAKPEMESAPEPEPEPKPKIQDLSDLSDLSNDEEEAVIQKVPEPGSGFEIDFADDDNDLQTVDDEQLLQDDDPEVKLDLARAYLSLGDKEASKSMLDEVLKNGNDAQKTEARQMMDEF